MRRSIWIPAVFILFAGCACLAQSDEQPSLGDVARANKAQKKAVKVLTEDDIPTHASADSSSAAGPSIKESAGSGLSDVKAPADKSAKGTAPSQSAPPASEIKKALDACKEQQDSWKKSAQHYEGLLAVETNDFRRQMYEDALTNDRKNVELFQKKIDQMQGELAAAEKSSH
jgi:hypothetical protein